MTKLLLCGAFILIVPFIHAQSSINATGKSIIGSSGSIDYSVGEITGSYASVAAGSTKQGVIQPYSSSVPLAVVNVIPDANVSLFPNPVVNNLLFLKSPKYKSGKLTIYDSRGQLVSEQRFFGEAKTIEVSNLTNGIYFIYIFTQKGEVLFTDKLIKL